MSNKLLSIVIPAYNEIETIRQVLDYIKTVNIGNYDKEIIVVDDGSKDGTREILKQEKDVKVLFNPKNLGKGGAVKEGIKHATGDYIVFQDADLEYDPADFKYMLPLMESGLVDVVIGTRFKGRKYTIFGKDKNIVLRSYLANKFFAWFWNILYNDNLTDVWPCYKIMQLSDLKKLNLPSNGFVFDLEMMIKLRKQGKTFFEAPIHFNPRGYAEGKKIKTRDALISIWYMIWYRIFNSP